MMGNLEIVAPDLSETAKRADEIARQASLEASQAWNDFIGSDPAGQIQERANELASSAWENMQIVAGDDVVDTGRNVTYLGGRGALGTAESFENAAEAGNVWIQSALGRREVAEEDLQHSYTEKLANQWTEFMGVNEGVEQLGDSVETAGEVVGAVGMATAAAAGIATASVPLGVGIASTGIASLGAAGESLDHSFAQDGKLTDEALAESAIAAAATAAAIAVPAGIARHAATVEAAAAGVDGSAIRNEVANFHEIREIPCRNSDLAGKLHPETGVPFRERTIVQESGEVIHGVFPEFESSFTAKIEPSIYEASNTTQFKECNRQLLEAVESIPEVRSLFSREQLEQIAEGVIDGSTPDGFVWHHNEVEGIIELVDYAIHARTGHTAGRFIWGGGY